MINIKSEQEINLMRQAGEVCNQIFEGLKEIIKPGITTMDINDYVEKICKQNKMIAAEKGYCGYPASACTSVNDEVIHGIPDKKKILEEGDIVGVDIVVENKGYMADACRTFAVGNVSSTANHLIETAEKAFFEALKYCKPGSRLENVSRAIQSTVEKEGYGVIREYTGHGIGMEMHEEPAVYNYVPKNPKERPANVRLEPGMTICIEPMITEGSFDIDILDDNWTAVTIDGKLSAHYENTVLITEDEPELLTLVKR